MIRNYDAIISFSKYFYFKRPRVANFADIIKIKQLLKIQTKSKELENLSSNAVYNFIS